MKRFMNNSSIAGDEMEFDCSLNRKSGALQRLGLSPRTTQLNLIARTVGSGAFRTLFWRLLIRLQFDINAGGCVKPAG
jgi:hypothetical protein